MDSIHERINLQTEMSEFQNGEELKMKVDQLQQELDYCRKRLLERKDVLDSEVKGRKKEYTERSTI